MILMRIFLILLFSFALLFSACSRNNKKILGITSVGPNEYIEKEEAGLLLPPNWKAPLEEKIPE